MTPFADLEADVNSAVMASLANTLITLNGTPDIPAIVNAGMNNATLDEPSPAGYAPNVQVHSIHVPVSVAGKALTVQTGPCIGTYRVTATEPDGTGLTTLYLTS